MGVAAIRGRVKIFAAAHPVASRIARDAAAGLATLIAADAASYNAAASGLAFAAGTGIAAREALGFGLRVYRMWGSAGRLGSELSQLSGERIRLESELEKMRAQAASLQRSFAAHAEEGQELRIALAHAESRLVTSFPLSGFSLLGHGGMGSVLRCHSARLDRDIVVKATARMDPLHLARFKEEERALSLLFHPNIVRGYGFVLVPTENLLRDNILDAGPTLPANFQMLAQELISGKSLGKWLKINGKMDRGLAIQVAAMVMRGAAAAHKSGILHRDFKSDNIMLRDAIAQAKTWLARPKGNEVVVIDFGVAKPLESGDRERKLTEEGLFVGTLEMLPSDVMEGAEDMGMPSDIYALGLLIFEMLTGEIPYRYKPGTGSSPDADTQVRGNLLMRQMRHYHEARRRPLPLIDPKKPNDPIQKLLEAMTAVSAIRRPTAIEVLTQLGSIAQQEKIPIPNIGEVI